ncbi:MAG: hypothetical protein ABIO91_07400 [Pyrinomonadaceae bacterium]
MNISKRRPLRALALLGIIVVISSVALAQTSTRIGFKRGATRSTVSGNLNNFKSRRIYLVKVRDGQTMRTEQIGGARRPITIFIRDRDGNNVGDSDASCNNRKEISPTRAGDYTIEVVECQKADPWRGRFTFRVAVR